MFRVCAQGERIDSAYHLGQGIISVAYGRGHSFQWEDSDIIFGTFEHFLPSECHASTQHFTISVSRPSQLQKVTFADVDAGIPHPDFGVRVNAFLARLLDYTNRELVRQSDRATRAQQAYHSCVQFFARMLLEAEALATRLNHADLKALTARAQATKAFSDGQALYQQQAPLILETPPLTLNEGVERYRRSAVICKEGQRAKCMYVLLSGRIRVAVGSRVVNVIDTPGEAFGELALFLDAKRVATLVAVQPTTVLVVNRDELSAFHQEHPDLFKSIARTLALRIYSNLKAIAQLEQPRRLEDAAARTQYLAQLEDAIGQVDDFLEKVDALSTGSQAQALKSFCARFQAGLKLLSLTF